MATASTPVVKDLPKHDIYSVYHSYSLVADPGGTEHILLENGKSKAVQKPVRYIKFVGSHARVNDADLEYIKGTPWYGSAEGCISADDWAENADGKDEAAAEGFVKQLLRRSHSGPVPFKSETKVSEMIRKHTTAAKAEAAEKAKKAEPPKK